MDLCTWTNVHIKTTSLFFSWTFVHFKRCRSFSCVNKCSCSRLYYFFSFCCRPLSTIWYFLILSINIFKYVYSKHGAFIYKYQNEIILADIQKKGFLENLAELRLELILNNSKICTIKTLWHMLLKLQVLWGFCRKGFKKLSVYTLVNIIYVIGWYYLPAGWLLA